MWSNTFATALDVRPEPSRRILWLVSGLHFLAIAGLLAVSPVVATFALPVLAGSLYLQLRRCGWLGGHLAITRIRIEPSGRWRIRDDRGAWLRVRVSPHSVCAGNWCLLRMESDRRRHVFALAPDSADAQALRQLRARLLAVHADALVAPRGFFGQLRRLDILQRRYNTEALPMPTQQERLEALLSDDPDHVYSEEELDAIEAIDAEMALRIDRVQTLARRQGEAVVAEDPVNEARVREAVEEARRILMQDGGDIEFVALQDRIVRVRLKGACVGCPRSALDLRNVVERLVRSKEPGVAKVVNEF
ncbi:NifU family protein [Thioalkalivibrio denitrificans]|uniref:NifU family protein n=1 Tax=Thioalkalivibrio denitrificans TaxID=108003 RepID=UPI000985E8A5|nr:NifU family protein [Thioalkalivibrio denitrificans]